MAEKKIIDGVQHSVVAIVFKGDEVLMFDRKGEEWETGWEFIKGAMHVGETEEEAMLREVDEEAGIRVEVIGKLPNIYWDKKLLAKRNYLAIRSSVFACKYISGKIRLGEPEHEGWKWMSVGEAMEKVWLKHGADAISKAYEVYKKEL